MDRKHLLLLLLFLALSLFATTTVFASTCENLSALKLPQAAITSAKEIAAGGFVPPGATAPPAGVKGLPAFCRITATVSPAEDSEIKVEVWMPLTGWNGRFRGLGNGGFAGYIDYPGLGTAISAGYAAASTDTGHSGTPLDASWALGHPAKITDFGWRAIHEMTLKAKAIVQAFYGDAPHHSYFSGCSNGGRQALMEAQRFPADYDGIIAGAPANYWTKVFATFVYDIQAMQGTPGSYISAAKIPAISKAVVAACDMQDGVKDGLLGDPRGCRPDAKALLCTQGDSPDCLTEPQAAALKKIYQGPYDAHGSPIYYGFEPGGEDGEGGWITWIGRAPGKDLQSIFAAGFFANMIKTDAPVDLKTITPEAAAQLAEAQQGLTFNADNPNLTAFVARNGKLIMYHGWSDAALPPLGAINYWQAVQAAMGREKAPSFLRLFMAPGMQHCGGGPGPNNIGQGGVPSDPQHSVHEALEQWVEKGTAPEKIIATKYVDDDRAKGVQMTRPLCPFPQIAHYSGTGSANDAANFTCVKGLEEIISPSAPGVTPPKPLHTPDPKYSPGAKRSNIQGKVKLSALIGADGLVHDVLVVDSLEPTLDANAIEAVKKWKFAPATREGHPVAVRLTLEVDYRLY